MVYSFNRHRHNIMYLYRGELHGKVLGRVEAFPDQKFWHEGVYMKLVWIYCELPMLTQTSTVSNTRKCAEWELMDYTLHTLKRFGPIQS